MQGSCPVQAPIKLLLCWCSQLQRTYNENLSFSRDKKLICFMFSSKWQCQSMVWFSKWQRKLNYKIKLGEIYWFNAQVTTMLTSPFSAKRWDICTSLATPSLHYNVRRFTSELRPFSVGHFHISVAILCCQLSCGCLFLSYLLLLPENIQAYKYSNKTQ